MVVFAQLPPRYFRNYAASTVTKIPFLVRILLSQKKDTDRLATSRLCHKPTSFEMSDQGWMVYSYIDGGLPTRARKKLSHHLVTNFGISFSEDDVPFVILSLFVSVGSYVQL